MITLYKNKYNSFIFRTYAYEINGLHPILEYKRYEIVERIKENIGLILKKYNFYSLIEINYITFSFISPNKSKRDPLIPIINKDLYDYDFFKEIIAKNGLEKETESIIKDVKKYIIPEIHIMYDEFYDFYIQKKYLQHKYDITHNRELETITLWYENEENTIHIKNDVYDNLVGKIINYPSSHLDLIYILALRYDIKNITTNNFREELNFLNGKLINTIIERYKINMMVGSSSLTTRTYFFSTEEYDIEKYFGGCGSYKNMKLLSGTFLIHIPFSPFLTIPINKKIIKYLDKASIKKKPLCIFYMLSLSSTQENKKISNCTVTEKQLTQKNPPEITILRKSKYVYQEFEICHDMINVSNLDMEHLPMKNNVILLVLKNKYYMDEIPEFKENLNEKIGINNLYKLNNQFDPTLRKKCCIQTFDQMFVYTDKQYYIDSVHPIIEFHRMEIIKEILEHFNNVMEKHKIQIYLNKINSMAIRFIWKHINKYDSVIPIIGKNKEYDFSAARTELSFIYKVPKDTIDHIINEINSIVTEIVNNKYYKLVKYYNERKFLDENYEINYLAETNQIIFKYLDKTIIIQVSKNVYNKLNKNCIIDENKNDLIFSLLYRYSLLDDKNQQLAISIPFKNQLKKNYQVDFELFGSGINRFFSNYCSLFYDIEKYFGSRGSFFTTYPMYGNFMCNPPYDADIMRDMSIHLVKCLDRAEKKHRKLLFIITIPVWDYETLVDIKSSCGIKNEIIDYGDYESLTILKKSKYFKESYKFCKEDFPYFNFREGRYIAASNTYIIIVKTTYADDINIEQYFDKIKSKENPY